MKLSIIIPTLNEENKVAELVRILRRRSAGSIGEILVVDGGSRDDTVAEAESAGAVVLQSEKRGRAVQMNFGAEHARYPLLFFLHADTVPPAQFDQKIVQAYEKEGGAGCFRLAFDSRHPILRFYAWFTRFDIDAFRFGDQGLFVSANLFNKIGGYNPDLILMEDNEIVRRLKRESSFVIIPDKMVTSARKYRANGVIRLQLIFTLIYVLFFLGFSQDTLVSTYKKFVSE